MFSCYSISRCCLFLVENCWIVKWADQSGIWLCAFIGTGFGDVSDVVEGLEKVELSEVGQKTSS